MSAYSILELTFRDILNGIKPLGVDLETRDRTINELRAVVESVESLRGATVEPFGSFVSNLFTRWGDLDISIQLPNGSYISSVGKKRKKNLLGDLLRALRRKGGVRKLQFIPNARVPILKFESNHQNISCDISINNLLGQMKSKFLLRINEIDGRFRDMILLVKEWAKTHDINNPKTGTLNSYSLCLLVIFHFQTCVPAILPPLKEIYPGNLIDDLQGVRTDAERRIEGTCDANIARIKSDRSRRVNQSFLSELFISFLVKFSDISSKTSEQGICPFTGQWEDIRSNTRWLPKTYAIFIEDPFERPENTARSVGNNQLTKIGEAFETTRRTLMSANHQNRDSLLATLVRPQTLIFVPSTRPQVHSPAHSPSHFQHQFPNMRIESRPNTVTMQRPDTVTMQRPVQTFHSQGQRVWRPRYSDK